MTTTLRLRDYLSRELTNATPGTSDATDHLGRDVVTGNVDHLGRTLNATTRANTTAYALGAYVEFASNKLYVCTGAGTSAASPPSETGVDYGETLADGTVTWTRVF